MAKFEVLIVDDDYINRKLLIEILKKKLYQVETIESLNGEDALNRLQEKNHIQLILLDIEMPEVDGIEFLERYNNNNKKKIPIIAISSNDTRKKESLNSGANAFIVKPVTEDKLMEAIHNSTG